MVNKTQQNTNNHTGLNRSLQDCVVTNDNLAGLSDGISYKNKLFLSSVAQLHFGSLRLQLPDNRVLIFGGKHPGPDAELVLRNWNLPMQLFAGGSVGAGESYMDGDWDSPNITTLFELFAQNENLISSFSNPGLLKGIASRIIHWCHTNTRSGSRKNIAAHYDLGNEFYSKWLDNTMTYSSGIFDKKTNSLSASQMNKYASLAKAIGIKSGDHILEIGCGWGGFAEYAAKKYDCQITALTISREQHEFAQERIQQAGLAQRVQIKLQDYRDETGQYDKVASIEMFEAVGKQYWQTYFEKIGEVLKSGGTAGLQIITIQDKSYRQYSTRPDFIQRYIFPGGMLPSPKILDRLGTGAGMKLLNKKVFAQDYAKTLAAWRRRFNSRWHEIRLLGFDERFKRMWEFYLHYCEAGFKSERIDVRQVFYRKP
ncbi:MAG: cyclopropane-fatty-acyl-phospholipid synthase family protein [Rhizobiaceae bacterium]|nr:cyclopropane-fatty-acyl-phospholipid synthase family protein [Rhizobiaceae bacterium]